MATIKQASILTACFDIMVSVSLETSHKAHRELAQNLIDTLCNYPHPKDKGSHTDTRPEILGAYLYASTARNTLKLALLGYVPFDAAFISVYECLELALSLLTDNQ